MNLIPRAKDFASEPSILDVFRVDALKMRLKLEAEYIALFGYEADAETLLEMMFAPAVEDVLPGEERYSAQPKLAQQLLGALMRFEQLRDTELTGWLLSANTNGEGAARYSDPPDFTKMSILYKRRGLT